MCKKILLFLFSACIIGIDLSAKTYILNCQKQKILLYYCGGNVEGEKKQDTAAIALFPPNKKPKYTALAHAYPDTLQVHRGIDLIGDKEILTAARGIVVSVCDNAFLCGSYGKYIIIKHEENLFTLYAHLEKIFVDVADFVERKNAEIGTIIGIMGNTGYSFGRHLHFEVRSASSHSYHFRLDPVAFLTIYLDECSDMFGLKFALQVPMHKYQKWYRVDDNGKIISQKTSLL